MGSHHKRTRQGGEQRGFTATATKPVEVEPSPFTQVTAKTSRK
ncbi:hypothetical protein ABT040_22280 [Streptomyces sp. NPDC002688]